MKDYKKLVLATAAIFLIGIICCILYTEAHNHNGIDSEPPLITPEAIEASSKVLEETADEDGGAPETEQEYYNCTNTQTD